MLTEDQKGAFETEGYLVFEGLLPEERVSYYRGIFRDLVTQGERLRSEIPHWSLESDEKGDPIAGSKSDTHFECR